MMVSIKDVATACGVSVSTVSKALNDQKDVSEAKKDLIRETAKQMGYLPNSSARALKTNKSKNIGVLFVDGAQSGLTHHFFSGVLDSFKITAEKHGYDVTFIRAAGGGDSMTYLEHSRFRRFDGVVIACVDFEEQEVIELMQSEIPVVNIDYTYNNTISILSNNIKGMQDLTEYAISMGHRKIAYIYGEKSLVTTNRLSGFYITMDKYGIDVPDEYVVQGKYRDMESAAKLTEDLLNLKEPPTCILYCDDFAGFGGMNMIRSKGLRIPEDISVAGYDGMEIAMQIEPQLTTMVQDVKRIGKLAGERLISMIEKPKTTVIEQVMVDAKLFEGKTIAHI